MAPTNLHDGPVDLAIDGTAVLPHTVMPHARILVRDGQIVWVGPRLDAPSLRARTHIEHDGVILPGLIDVHCHGGGGESFPDARSTNAMMTAVMEHRRYGTTTMLASLVTASRQVLRTQVEALHELTQRGEIAGAHLEGPFISATRCGAQNPAHIIDGDPELVQELGDAAPGTIRAMTIAPETPQITEVIDALVRIGAIPSLGHTDCSSEQMTAAITHANIAMRKHRVSAPAPTATHLFNGMRPAHHRDPGPVLACLDAAAQGELVAEVIGDGVHLDARTVAHVFAISEPDSVVLITDAMAAAGMPDGSYQLGSLAVTVYDGTARLAAGDSIAGGTAHLLDVVRFTVFDAGVDMVTAVRAASVVPARLLGMEQEIGAIAEGLRADLVLVDEGFAPETVYRSGKRV